MIVVVSHAEDPHAVEVLRRLAAAGRDALLLDLGDLPNQATLTLDYDEGRPTRLVYDSPAGRRDLLDATAVWWRRPQAPTLDAIVDPDVYQFTHNEWQEALNGLWQLVDAPWMNPPARDEVATRKALQLRVAGEVGLRTPRTLITSDPAEARAFIAAQKAAGGRTVFKTFSCTYAIWRETRVVGAGELDLLDQVRVAPVIFQEYVPGVDLRITIVGGDVFPASIDPQGTDYDVDFRMSLGQARTEAAELPDAVVKRLRLLMDRLGLVYGAVDMRRTAEGDYVFLEVNTAGEFLFIEERTGQPIADAVVRWLSSPTPA